MKVAVLVLVMLAMASALSHQEALDKFVSFQHKYKKVYHNQEEFVRRFENFKTNIKKAEELTEKNRRTGGSATFGITKFSDLSEAEFTAQYLMPPGSVPKPTPSAPKQPWVAPNIKPKRPGQSEVTFDWSQKGATTPIKNQGQCGSCWAFSATETIESYWFLAGHSLPTLSEQQIVDCDTTDQGCNGGFPSSAYQYVQSAGGLDTEASYPYTAEGGSCNFKPNDVAANVTGWDYAGQNDENAMLSWLKTKGPISICVDASSWSSYTGGVMTSCSDNVDHCVQLTGYGTDPQAGAFWNVRNSWGTDWGVSGYIWLQQGQNMCDMASTPTYVCVKGSSHSCSQSFQRK